ncbi:transglycosylase SLT domain-containing protein, partial [Candidatus Thiosymbion oneisti]
MTTTARFRIPLIVLLFLVLPFAGCSSSNERELANRTVSAAKRPTGSRTFPVPSEIKDNVAFWRNVYGEWSRGEVAIHDNEYMGVIYEVADLPGPTLNGYTAEQKRFVRARKAYYKRRLKNLEDKVRAGLSLSRYDRSLYNRLMGAGGKWAIYGASNRVRSQRGLRERFRRGLAISGRYDAKFREIFRSRGLPEDLAYLPHVESSFQTHARSSVGAAGVWQFMRGTGKLYMIVNGAVDERLDPVTAAEGAASYLGGAYRKLGSWPLAVTSYNHGQAGMQKAKAIYGNDIGAIVRKYKGPYFKFASRNFYAEFIAAREVASHPHRYFPEGIKYQAPLSEDRLVLRRSISAPRIAHYYDVPTYRLADLNLHWKKSVRRGSAKLPAGSTVWLPRGTLKRAGHIAPSSVLLAKAEYRPKAKRKSTRTARAESRQKPIRIAKVKPRRKPTKVAKAESRRKPIRLAKAEPKRKPTRVAKARSKPKPVQLAKAGSKRKPIKLAKAKPKRKPTRVAKARSKSKPVQLAKAGSKRKPIKIAKARLKQKPGKVAKAKPKSKPVKVAKAKASGALKVHVVKPNETLYGVSTYYKMSVAELRRLNRMGPGDTNIRSGQRLRVKVAKAEPKQKPVKVAKAKPKSKPVKVAKARLKQKPVKVAKARPKRKPGKVAKAKPKSKPVKVAKAKASGALKVHVVKPNETLYGVSTYYKMSVAELRRLNRMGPGDT